MKTTEQRSTEKAAVTTAPTPTVKRNPRRSISAPECSDKNTYSSGKTRISVLADSSLTPYCFCTKVINGAKFSHNNWVMPATKVKTSNTGQAPG